MTAMKPTALIIQTAGTNCDRELAHAFELAGAQTRTVHVNKLIQEPAQIESFDLIGFPGGFSYGDDIAAGRIFANRLRHRLYEPLRQARERGVPMIGICNGFQVLVKLGLLPDPADINADTNSTATPQTPFQTATLADNIAGRFIDRWLAMEADEDCVCIWTRGLDTGKSFDLPIAHGEGRLVPASDEVLQRWRQNKQIALRYADGQNVNGSVDRIAGICDPTGLILGLMPHPERFINDTQHPQWSRHAASGTTLEPAGLKFFQNAVGHVLSKTASSATA